MQWACFNPILTSWPYLYFWPCSSPPARWGLLDFNRALLLLLRLLTRRLLLAVQIPVGTAGPPPRAPDPSGHCRPGLNRELQIAVCTAGPQPRLPGRSGHCRTSTASSRSQWALPDLNRELQIAVGTAGPQPRLPGRSGHCRTSTASSRSQWALPDLNGQIECQKICQMECQIECQKICLSDRMPEDMSDRMPEDIPDRMPEDLPDRMPEDMPEDMPDRMPEDMSDRMPEDLPVRKCTNVMVGITRSKVILGIYIWKHLLVDRNINIGTCSGKFQWHLLPLAILGRAKKRGGALLPKHRPCFQLKDWTGSGRAMTRSEPGSGKPSVWLQGPKAMLGVTPTGLTVWPMTLWSCQCFAGCERMIGNCRTWTHWGVRWQVFIIVWASKPLRKSSTACLWK